jgi:hypothetical protein
MKTKNRRRTSFISAKDLPLSNKALRIWGYSKDEKFVCRLEVNSAGVAVFAGEKGKTKICDVSWETLVEKLK